MSVDPFLQNSNQTKHNNDDYWCRNAHLTAILQMTLCGSAQKLLQTTLVGRFWKKKGCQQGTRAALLELNLPTKPSSSFPEMLHLMASFFSYISISFIVVYGWGLNLPPLGDVWHTVLKNKMEMPNHHHNVLQSFSGRARGKCHHHHYTKLPQTFVAHLYNSKEAGNYLACVVVLLFVFLQLESRMMAATTREKLSQNIAHSGLNWIFWLHENITILPFKRRGFSKGSIGFIKAQIMGENSPLWPYFLGKTCSFSPLLCR